MTTQLVPLEIIQNRILLIIGLKIMLDSDQAEGRKMRCPNQYPDRADIHKAGENAGESQEVTRKDRSNGKKHNRRF